jgi:hypothetical protein
MKELKFGKNMLVLSIMTLLTTFTWIGFEVYRAYTRPTIPKIITQLIRPLDPKIDQAVIEDIKEKYQPSPDELNTTIVPLPSPVEEELELEVELEEEATPSPTATPSAGL